MSKSEKPEVYTASVEVVDDTNSKEITVYRPPMTAVEAQQCLQEIKSLGFSLRALLLELDIRRGWEALSYPSMTACLKAEFAEMGSKSTLIREWNAGQMERELQVQICTYPAYQLRPLRKLNPQQRPVAMSKAREKAGNARMTEAHVTSAVNEILAHSQLTRQTLPSKYLVGDFVRIQCTAGALPEQKVWNGCWGIVLSTGNISSVNVLVGSKEVNYMTSDLDWDDNLDIEFYQTANQILNLWQQQDLEPVEENLLKFLQRRHFFTDLEKQIISLMEAKRLSPQ